MGVRMLFVISAPRSGSTMLERMLESHSQIAGGPEPHLLTPLAHLGPWAKVDKAPYDHILAAESQKLFVDQLPGKEQDYWSACRAYCDVLYGRYLESKGGEVCLDKTPAYALILPFMMKVFPDAKYVVLTRHPLATFASFANSFFDGDYEVAQNYNPLLNRYVPAIAEFLRQTEVPPCHVRYEDLVADPETWMKRIYEYIGVPFERETIDYGEHRTDEATEKGLGDPISVQQYSRPTTAFVHKWAEELAADDAKRALMERVISEIPPEDLEQVGYPLDTLWAPMNEVAGKTITPKKPKLSRYRIQRKAIVGLRGIAQRNALFRKLLDRIRLTCEVLLREQ